MTLEIHEVFTPMSPADCAYTGRDAYEPLLRAALAAPGRQVLVHGPTGAGKTTLTVRTLRRLGLRSVFTACRRQGDLLDAATEAETLHGPMAPPPPESLTQVAAWLEGNDLRWVLEDTHKLPPQAQRQLVGVMRACATPRILALTTAPGLVGDEVLGVALQRIAIAPMTARELDAMLVAGATALNVDIPAWMRQGIIAHADGHPAICHQFALHLCLEAAVYQRLAQLRTIPEDAFARARERTPKTLI